MTEPDEVWVAINDQGQVTAAADLRHYTLREARAEFYPRRVERMARDVAARLLLEYFQGPRDE